MEASKKRSLKRKAKRCLITGYLLALLSITLLIVTIIVRNNTEGEWGNATVITFLCCFMLPLFAGLVFAVFSGMYKAELQVYKSMIIRKRARRAFIWILDAFKAGEFRKALDIYTDYNVGCEKVMSDILYGIVLGEIRNNPDPDWQKKANDRLDKLREIFNPDSITLD
jgi:RsiW-degrading membrane proteinase PrsW (M82 family)